MTLLENLIKVRTLIDDPEEWTQTNLARDVEDNAVHPCSVEATCWCAVGAIAKACSRPGDLAAVPSSASAYGLFMPFLHHHHHLRNDKPNTDAIECMLVIGMAMRPDVPEGNMTVSYVHGFNDKHGHRDVLDAIDKAIENTRHA